MDFEIVGEFEQTRTIATGSSIRELARLVKVYGPGRWRKRKAVVRVRFLDGSVNRAEIHWYEAHGVGRYELKIKRILENS